MRARGRGALDAVFRNELRAEGEVADHMVAATVVYDLRKLFGRISHGLLALSGLRLDFPPVVLLLAIMGYGAPRFIALGGAVAPAACPTRGIAAGDVFAVALTKVYIMAFGDRIAAAADCLTRRLADRGARTQEAGRRSPGQGSRPAGSLG